MDDHSSLRIGIPRRRNLLSHVVGHLGGRIVRGEISPGDLLPSEAQLGRDLRVSRTVVREAVKSLAAKGLLESRTRTGARVLPPTHWNLLDYDVLTWRYAAMPRVEFVRELFEIRLLIEPAAAELAAARATRVQLAEIEVALQSMELADRAGEDALEADLAFHRAVLAGSGNVLLLQLGALVAVGLLMSFSISRETFKPFLKMHRHVYEAVARRDGAKARKTMQELIVRTRRFLERAERH